jgi:arabinosaccharide transport system substrate-binding protein
MPGCNSSTDGGGRTVVTWFFQTAGGVFYGRESEVEKKFNIKLQTELVAQNAYLQKLQAVMNEGKGVPDIGEWMIQSNKLSGDPKNCFAAPLDDFVKNSTVMKTVPAGRVAWVTIGGHIYGLPHDVHPVVLIYNDTLWQEAGVDLAKVKTWDEFFDGAKKLCAKQEGGKPLHYALPTSDGGLTDTMFMIWQQTGAEVFDNAGKPTFDSDQFKAFMTKWISWKDMGVFAAWDWGNFAYLLKEGTYCSYLAPDWWVGQVSYAAKEGKYKFKVRDLPLYEGSNISTASWGGYFLFIPKNSKNKDFSWNIIEYILYGNKKEAVSRYKTGGMVAPVADAWDDPVFHQPDDRFGGQKLGELQIAAAKEIPSIKNSDVFWEGLEAFGKQYTEMIGKKESVDEGLRKTQDAVLKRMK